MAVSIPGLKDLLKAGVHFGHSVGRWHPKAEEFIHSARSGVHIIDLEKTQSQLKEVLALIEKMASEGKTILYVGTKRQAEPIIIAEAERAGMPYVKSRWLGGLLTNFTAMRPMLDTYRKLCEEQDSGAWEKYTKKERVQFEKVVAKKDMLLKGLRGVKKLPDALFVVDVRKEKTAIREAQTLGIPVIAIVDTNINPEQVTHVIPGNDDAVKSISLLVKLVSDAIVEGKKLMPEKPVKKAEGSDKKFEKTDKAEAKS